VCEAREWRREISNAVTAGRRCRGNAVTIRARYIRGLLFLLSASLAFTQSLAQGDGAALAALKLLPKDAAKRLARIEAWDGVPQPERRHFLAHDPDE